MQILFQMKGEVYPWFLIKSHPAAGLKSSSRAGQGQAHSSAAAPGSDCRTETLGHTGDTLTNRGCWWNEVENRQGGRIKGTLQLQAWAELKLKHLLIEINANGGRAEAWITFTCPAARHSQASAPADWRPLLSAAPPTMSPVLVFNTFAQETFVNLKIFLFFKTVFSKRLCLNTSHSWINSTEGRGGCVTPCRGLCHL